MYRSKKYYQYQNDNNFESYDQSVIRSNISTESESYHGTAVLKQQYLWLEICKCIDAAIHVKETV